MYHKDYKLAKNVKKQCFNRFEDTESKIAFNKNELQLIKNKIELDQLIVILICFEINLANDKK